MWHALPGRTSGGGFTEGCLTAVSCQTMCVLMRPPVQTRHVFLDLFRCRVCRRHEMDGRRMTVVLMRARAGESKVLATERDNYDTMGQITWNHQTTWSFPPEKDTRTPLSPVWPCSVSDSTSCFDAELRATALRTLKSPSHTAWLHAWTAVSLQHLATTTLVL
jgi:hypothetical protein